MATKTRFNKSNQGGLGSSLVGSTRVNKTGAVGGSGFGAAAGGKAPSHVQVIYNGKIVTPVSLLAKPKGAASTTTVSVSKGEEESKASAPANSGAAANEDEKPPKVLQKKESSVTNNRARYVSYTLMPAC